jgi:hypothetical protein
MKHLCRVLQISEGFIKDPVLIESMRILFKWSNDMGLAGKEVSNFKFAEPHPDIPHFEMYSIWCEIEDVKDKTKE